MNEFTIICHTTPIPIKGLSHSLGISCFIDTLLTSIYTSPIHYFIKNTINHSTYSNTEPTYDKYKLHVKYLQLFLTKLHTSIFSPKHARMTIHEHTYLLNIPFFASLIKDAQLHNGGDEVEFLQLFMEFFKLTPTRIKIITFISNDKQHWIPYKTSIEYHSIIYQTSDIQQIQDIVHKCYSQEIQQPDEPIQLQGVTYRYVNYHKYIINSDCLIIKTQTYSFIKSIPIEFRWKNKTFQIKCITMFNNNHYTSLIYRHNEWYYYNDMTISIKKIKIQDYMQQIKKYTSLVIFEPL